MAGVQKQAKPAAAFDDTSPLVIPARLEIRNSRVIIGYNDQFYRIPFEFDIVPQDPEYDVLDIAAHLYPRGEKISATVKVDRPQRRAALRIDSATLNLDRFADIAARVAGLMLSGEMTLHGKAEVRWQPLQISAVNASLVLRHGKIMGRGLQLQTAMAANNEEIPFRIDLSAKNTNAWQISGSRISMIAPTHLTLTGFDGMIKRNAASLESSGNFSAVLHSSTQTMHNLLPVKIQDPLPLQGRFSAIYHQSGKWQCEVSNNKPAGPAAKTVRADFSGRAVGQSVVVFRCARRAEAAPVDYG